MTRNKFLSELADRLAALPEEDRRKTLDYYRELIDDRMESGLSEEEAVEGLGTPAEIADRVLEDTPFSTPDRKRPRPKKRLKTWQIVLLCVTGPLWLPLLIAGGAVTLALFVAALAVAVSLIFAAAACILSVPAGLIQTVTLLASASFPDALLTAGLTLLTAGLAILIGLGSIYLPKALINGIRRLFRRLRKIISGKGN